MSKSTRSMPNGLLCTARTRAGKFFIASDPWNGLAARLAVRAAAFFMCDGPEQLGFGAEPLFDVTSVLLAALQK